MADGARRVAMAGGIVVVGRGGAVRRVVGTGGRFGEVMGVGVMRAGVFVLFMEDPRQAREGEGQTQQEQEDDGPACHGARG